MAAVAKVSLASVNRAEAAVVVVVSCRSDSVDRSTPVLVKGSTVVILLSVALVVVASTVASDSWTAVALARSSGTCSDRAAKVTTLCVGPEAIKVIVLSAVTASAVAAGDVVVLASVGSSVSSDGVRLAVDLVSPDWSEVLVVEPLSGKISAAGSVVASLSLVFLSERSATEL